MADLTDATVGSTTVQVLDTSVDTSWTPIGGSYSFYW